MRYPKAEIDRESALKLWNEEHSDYAKEQVILNNTGLVGYVLKSLGLNILDEDLQEIGVLGLCKAINGFDASKGTKFNTYAVWAVRNEILITLRKKRIVPAFSLDEEYQLDNGESVPYADMISSTERFDDLSNFKMDFDVLFEKLSEREKKIVLLSMNDATQMEIAQEIGISQSYVSRILKGIRKKIERCGF